MIGELFKKNRPRLTPLTFLQLVVIVATLFSLWMFMKATPIYYDKLLNECLLQKCEFAPMPSTSLANLEEVPITPKAYVLSFVAIDTLLVGYFYVAAFILMWKCFREPMGLLAAFMLISFGPTFPSTLPVSGVDHFIYTIGWSLFIIFFMIFPDGRIVTKWTGLVAIASSSIFVLGSIFPNSQFHILKMPILFKSIIMFLPILTIGYSQIYRFLKVSNGTERQQTKWVVYGFTLTFVLFIIINVFYIPGVTETPVSFIYLNAMISLCIAIIPTTIVFAVLKHRLWDVDPIVNKTIVYGVLTISIILIYVIVVLYLGRMFQTDGNLFISLVATGLVAVIFAPLKDQLQKRINQLMYGRKEEPFRVLTSLSKQWEKPMSLEETLGVVVKTIRESLKLSYTAITFSVDSRDTLVATSGEESKEVIIYPIIYHGETLGNILLASKSLGEEFRKVERELLEALIRQAGPIIQGVKMSVEMKLLVEEVQESREKLVIAREEERLKLRRNLHDDLAPRLAALALNIATAERLVKKDPLITLDILSGLKETIRATVDDIRTLVHDLRPPTLDEFGLVGAIQQRIQDFKKVTPGLNIILDLNGVIPPLPAAVEVAVYRIVTESIVNVVRHSYATECQVELEIKDGKKVTIEITDNGVGLSKRRTHTTNGGIGMQSMREQAVELGGKCIFETPSDGGMRVHAMIPFDTGRELNENLVG